MKKRIFMIIFLLIMIVLGLGVTYSAFTSEMELIINQEIASFIFEANQTDHISLALSDLKPGDKTSYKFSVSNNKEVEEEVNVSNVTINYQILISTYHFMPLNINLYKGDSIEPLLVCDETIARTASNEIVCTTEIQNMEYTSGITDDYELKLEFDGRFNQEEFSDLVDYIDIEIKSWQKVGDTE